MISSRGTVTEYFNHKGPFHYVTLDFDFNLPSYANIYAVYDWCLDNLGIDSKDTWFANPKEKRFYFLRKEDMLLFILRWSS